MGSSSTTRILDSYTPLSFDNKENNDKSIFFDAYISMRYIQEILKTFENISIDAYLISTNTISNFKNIIKPFKDVLSINQADEFKLNNSLKYYDLEKNIKIIYEYTDCQKILGNEKENEFIIVDELFCRAMKIDKYYEKNKKVNINIDKQEFISEIKFNSGDIIDFKEHERGFYKFLGNKIDDE